ncbi:MAG: secondary thiamine-phosphate synthase enzyme YjbQ [Lachnospiraceae bacterium]|jgi:secondary thiamine-phosphate synthase enzyme
MLQKFNISTQKDDVFDITEEVRKYANESGVQEGIVVVYTAHTTASICVTSKMDPAGFDDLRDEINRLIPTRIDFKHQFDTPSDAAGHIKSSLIGVSMTFIITGGKLLLGGSQGIYFLEHDGPRKRSYFVKVIEG